MTSRGPVRDGVRSRVIRQSSRSARATKSETSSDFVSAPTTCTWEKVVRLQLELLAGHAYLRSPNVLTKIPTLSASNTRFPQTAGPANPEASPDPPPAEAPQPSVKSEPTSKQLKTRGRMGWCEISGNRTTNTLPSRLAVYYNTPVARHGKKPQKPHHRWHRTSAAQLA